MSTQPDPPDDPPEDASPTPPPRAHACDEDCAGHLDADGFCDVCGVHHGDPCGSCDGRGFHHQDCPEMEERSEPIDHDEERAAAADARYDSDRDDRLTDPERQP